MPNSDDVAVLGRLDGIDSKLTAVTKNLQRSGEKIGSIQKSQAEMSQSIAQVRSAVATTAQRMADLSRSAEQMRADFTEFRQEADKRLDALANLLHAVGSDVIRILELAERSELRRSQQLVLTNIVQEASAVLEKIDDRVIRYMAAVRLRSIFKGHQLTAYSFEDVSARRFFQDIDDAIDQSIKNANESDVNSVSEYDRANHALSWVALQQSELDARESAANRDDVKDHARIGALRTKAETLRASASTLTAKARSRGVMAAIVAIIFFGGGFFRMRATFLPTPIPLLA